MRGDPDVTVSRDAREGRDRLVVVVNVILRGSTALAQFVLVIALTATLGTGGLGTFHLFVIGVDYGRQLVGFSYYVFIVREIAGSDEGSWPGLVANHIHFQALSALVWMPVGAALWIWFDVPATLAGAFLIVTTLDLLALQFENTLVATGRSILAAIVLFSRRGLWVGLLIVLMLFDRVDSVGKVYPIWAMGLAASCILGGWLLTRIGIPIRISTKVDTALLRRGLGVAARYFVIAAFVVVVQSAAKIVLAASDGSVAVGELYFFYGILSAAATVGTGGVAMLFLPRLIRAQRMRDSTGFRAAFRSLFWGSIVAAVTLSGTALGILPVLLETMDRPDLQIRPALLLAVTVATLAMAMTTVPHSVLYSISRDRSLLGITALGAGVAVLGALLLIPNGGVLGAAWALAGGNMTLLLGYSTGTVMAWRSGAVPS